MKNKICVLVLFAAWSVVAHAESKVVKSKKLTTRPIEVQKALAEMKQRFEDNHKTFEALKAEWQKKRDDRQQEIAALRANDAVHTNKHEVKTVAAAVPEKKSSTAVAQTTVTAKAVVKKA